MQIAKWIRERLGGEGEDDATEAVEPEAPAQDETPDESDDDPSVYPLW
jgi:hypothetical protein